MMNIHEHFLRKLIKQPKWLKYAILISIDFLVLLVAIWFSYVLRQFDLNADVVPNLPYGAMIISISAIFYLFITGCYSFVVRNFNEIFMFRIAIATFFTVITLYLMAYLTPAIIPMSIPIMFGFLMFNWIWLSRGLIRFIIKSLTSSVAKRRIMIYGAGSTGHQVAELLTYSNEYIPVCFIDDSPLLSHRISGGLKIYSYPEAMELLNKGDIDEILIALPSVQRSRRQEIIHSLQHLKVKIREVPSLEKLVDGKIKLSDVQDIDVIDLLGRDPIEPIQHLLDKNIVGKVVMVTGAGGSIGSELCRQIVKNKPQLLVLFEVTEFALYNIEKELKMFSNCDLIPVLGSVLDQEVLEEVIEKYKIQTIYHAAAYKHVPLVECNPIIGLKNNTVGTANSVNAAVAKQVETFVLISTDKAVRPTNVMGASKRMAELYCQAIATTNAIKTQISIVRFGNVLGSSGSVVPLFKQQILKGGPVTVTHPEVTRYFMTIPEAAQLVIQAGAMGQGGDIFLLDMGKPVKIVDLAKQMICLNGLTVKDDMGNGDIEIQYSGLRAGEKLYEELLIDQEDTEITEHTRIIRSYEKYVEFDEIAHIVDQVRYLNITDKSLMWAIEQLEKYVDGYKCSIKIDERVDLLE